MVLLVLCDSGCVITQQSQEHQASWTMLILVLLVSTAFWTLQDAAYVSVAQTYADRSIIEAGAI